MDYQLSHATKYGIGVALTTKVIISRLGGVVKVLGEIFRRVSARAGGATPPLRENETGDDLSCLTLFGTLP